MPIRHSKATGKFLPNTASPSEVTSGPRPARQGAKKLRGTQPLMSKETGGPVMPGTGGPVLRRQQGVSQGSRTGAAKLKNTVPGIRDNTRGGSGASSLRASRGLSRIDLRANRSSAHQVIPTKVATKAPERGRPDVGRKKR